MTDANMAGKRFKVVINCPYPIGEETIYTDDDLMIADILQGVKEKWYREKERGTIRCRIGSIDISESGWIRYKHYHSFEEAITSNEILRLSNMTHNKLSVDVTPVIWSVNPRYLRWA